MIRLFIAGIYSPIFWRVIILEDRDKYIRGYQSVLRQKWIHEHIKITHNFMQWTTIFSTFTFRFEYRELSFYSYRITCYSLLVLLQNKMNWSIILTIDTIYRIKIYSRVKHALHLFFGLDKCCGLKYIEYCKTLATNFTYK